MLPVFCSAWFRLVMRVVCCMTHHSLTQFVPPIISYHLWLGFSTHPFIRWSRDYQYKAHANLEKPFELRLRASRALQLPSFHVNTSDFEVADVLYYLFLVFRPWRLSIVHNQPHFYVRVIVYAFGYWVVQNVIPGYTESNQHIDWRSILSLGRLFHWSIVV